MKRVFIFSTRSLFAQGIKSLLRCETDLDLIGWETDADKAVRRIQEIHPDVVILANKEAACDPLPDVMRLLKEGTRTKIIVLNLEDNTMCIYCGEQRLIQDVKDLIKAIKGPLAAGMSVEEKETQTGPEKIGSIDSEK